MKWVFLGLITIFSSRVNAGDWIFASGKVEFSIKNAGLTVNGSFPGLRASVKFNPEQISNTHLEGSVQVNSIETGIQLRNQHLQKATYFHAQRFPEISMKLEQLETDGSEFKGHFILNLKGISKKVTVPVAFSTLGREGQLLTKFSINRRDFGVGSSSWTMADQVEVLVYFLLKPS